MNTASQDLKHHLSVLLERLQHPTDYEKALHYFLEEFAGDEPFVTGGDVVEVPLLDAVLRHVLQSASGKPHPFRAHRIMRVHGHGFHHGSGSVDGRVVLFFHFESVNKGLVAVIPGFQGPVDVARFSLPASLAVDTSRN